MFVDKCKKDKNNIFISTKEININKNNKIYFYVLPLEWISFIKSTKDKYKILFYDQYDKYKLIFIQENNNYDYVGNKNSTRFVGINNTFIISNHLIENFPCLKIIVNDINKCYITICYNLIYECLIYNIVLFNEHDLSE